MNTLPILWVPMGIYLGIVIAVGTLQEAEMPYWIHDNGETIGPMRAIDVLRRAQPTTRICDGENWFWLDDGSELSESRFAEAEGGEIAGDRARVTIR